MTVPYRVTRGAIDVAEGVVGLIVLRLRQHDDHSSQHGSNGSEPTAWRPPAPNTMEGTPDAPTAPLRDRTTAQRTPRRPSTNGDGTATAPSGRSATTPRRAPRRPAAPVEPDASPSAPAPVSPEPEVAEAQVMPTEIVDAQVVSEPPAAPATPSVPEPVHVSEEPELVEENADPGAEDGAGAQITIAEPWDGYRQMKAADIIDRLPGASREELAAVELFETAGRKRKSVLAAAERALRQASPPRPR